MNTKQFLWFTPAILITIAIFLLSTVFSVGIQVEGVSFIDKIQHAFAYFTLTIAYLIGLRKSFFNDKKIAILIVVSCALYGFLLELTQYALFENRVLELADALANIIGCLIGYFTFLKLNFVL